MKMLKLLLAAGRPARLYAYVFFLIPLFTFHLPAQTVRWNFDGDSRSGSSSVSHVMPGSARTGPGVSSSGFPDEACSNGNPWSVRGWYNTNTIFDAVNRGDYISFSLRVESGKTFHITGLSFKSNRSVNAAGDEFGPRQWSVYGSHDNYANILFSGSNPSGETGTSASCRFHSKSVDIPLRGGESITFRIYAYGEAATEITTMRFDNITVSGTRLPIELIRFTAREINGAVVLRWQTETERSNAYIAVERSPDGENFMEIGRVAGAGTTAEAQNYFFSDDQPRPGVNYYRLRQVDFDGSERTYHTLSVDIDEREGEIRFFPTLVTDHLSIRYPKPPDEEGRLLFFQIAGRQIKQVNVPSGALRQQINVSSLQRGAYLLQYRKGRKAQVLGRFVKM